jgi:hypothetical protein
MTFRIFGLDWGDFEGFIEMKVLIFVVHSGESVNIGLFLTHFLNMEKLGIKHSSF